MYESTSLSEMMSYLKRCGGRDVLHFADSTEARDAAHLLNDRFDPVLVKIEASFDRVTMELRHAD